MAFCTKCGRQIPDGQSLCEQCAAASQNQNSFRWMGREETGRFSAGDIQSNRAMAVLSYIGILVLVPIFAAKGSHFARYHANQGLTLFLAEVVWGVFCGLINLLLGTLGIFSLLFWIVSGIVNAVLGILSLVFLVLAIYGIVNAASGKAKPLPVLGRFTFLR